MHQASITKKSTQFPPPPPKPHSLHPTASTLALFNSSQPLRQVIKAWIQFFKNLQLSRAGNFPNPLHLKTDVFFLP